MLPALALAESQDFQWGGKGYDPALKDRDMSARFTIRPHYDYSRIDPETKTGVVDESRLELRVDAEETVNELGSIILLSEGHELHPEQCWKAMRHITAPWACTFQQGDIRALRGKGTIRILDRSGHALIEAPADYDAMNAFLAAKR